MNRRVFSLILIVLLALGALSGPALAASGVDLSRVKFAGGEQTLEFCFGKIKLEGTVSQKYPFTEPEIQKLVQETLRAQGLTDLDIIEANRKVDKAARASKITKEDLARVRENLITTLGLTPASSATDVLTAVDQYMKSKSWDDIGTASVNMGENAMAKWVEETATGFIDQAGALGKNVNKVKEAAGKLMAIEKFCQMMMDEQARTKQKWTDIADGANAKRMLNDFYFALQNRIDAYKQKSDQAGWEIRFDEAMAGRSFTFFGVPGNYQTWTLQMLLKQHSTNQYGSVAGEYKGFYTITADHALEEFTGKPETAIRHMSGIGPAIAKMEATPGFKATLSRGADSAGTASIQRTIEGDCSVTIQDSGEISLSLDERSDETVVSISGMAVDLDYETTGSAIIVGSGHIIYRLAAEKEEMELRGVTAEVGVDSPQGKLNHSLGAGVGKFPVGWDKSIWDPWDGQEKTLRHVG